MCSFVSHHLFLFSTISYSCFVVASVFLPIHSSLIRFRGNEWGKWSHAGLSWCLHRQAECQAHLTFSDLQCCCRISWRVTWPHKSHKTFRADWLQTDCPIEPTLTPMKCCIIIHAKQASESSTKQKKLEQMRNTGSCVSLYFVRHGYILISHDEAICIALSNTRNLYLTVLTSVKEVMRLLYWDVWQTAAVVEALQLWERR